MKYFSYDSDSGFEIHETEEEAIKSANDAIDYYRDNASEGWSEEVDTVCWGEIKQKSSMFDLKPLTDELRSELNIDPICDMYCDYKLQTI